MRSHIFTALLTAIVIIGISVQASSIAPFTEYNSGDPLTASDLNSRFNTITNAVTENDSRLNLTIQNNGFLAIFDFEEKEGTSSKDQSGNKNSLTLSTTGVSWNLTGHTGSALNFDGVSGYLEAVDHPSLNPTIEITVSAWVFLPGTNNLTVNYCLVCKEGQYQLGINSGVLQFAVQTINGPVMAWVGSSTVPRETWVQVSASYDGQAIRTYINGALTSYSSYANGTLATSSNVLRLGTSAADADYFAGVLDEVRIMAEVRNLQPGMSTLVTVVGPLSDQRNGAATSAPTVWWDIPDRLLQFTKRYDHSRLKVTYQDTLGTLGRFYQGCEWQILLDGTSIAFFSTADLDAVLSWRMSNAAHIAWATAKVGNHTITVQNRGNRGAWVDGDTRECLSGWNTTGNFLSVEEIP